MRKNWDLIKIFESVNSVTIPSKSIIKESRKTEDDANRILASKNVTDTASILNDFKNVDKSKNQILLPIMAYFYDGRSDLSHTFNNYVSLLNKNSIKAPIYTRNGIKIGDESFNDFIKFSEYVDKLYGAKLGGQSNTSGQATTNVEDEAPLFDKNNILIYDGNDVGKCIKYTMGGATGKHYGFCIGQPANTMWQSYRDSKTSTFYYVIDKNRDMSDPLHIVVVDHTKYGFELTDANNATGNIAEYGDDADAYIQHLKNKGVPTESIFTNKLKNDQEKDEDKLLGRKNENYEWFVNLSPEFKSKYIGRGFKLTDQQFKNLWDLRNNTFTAKLINQYLNIGFALPENQFQLLTQG